MILPRSLRQVAYAFASIGLALAITAGPSTVARTLAPHAQASAAGSRYITSFQVFHTSFTRNFNPFDCGAGTAMDFTCGAIYEPLYILTTAGGGHQYPWLATAYRFTDGGKTLLLTIRHGVQWSDGQPFTAADVLFTLTYGQKFPGTDQISYVPRNTSNVKSINLVGTDQVAIHFRTVDVTVLPRILTSIKIVPQHIWAHVKDPMTFTNPSPVGTGPFTQVLRFSNQEYVLGRNPHYWQLGEPRADGLRVPLYTGNDSANLALAHGDLDWESTFVPKLQQIWVKPDPAHHHYYLGDLQGANGLFFNDQVYPFSLTGFRKAISYAVDRTKIWQIGEYGYEPPTDAIGVAAVWPTWMDKSLTPAATELARYNPAKAKALLATLGFKTKDGQLYDPRGHLVHIQLSVPSGWTDYVLDCQIIQQDLQALGIATTVKLMDLNSWTERQNKGDFSAILQAPPNGTTPYYYFNSYMSSQSYVPTGQDASLKGFNLERWTSPAADKLLTQYQQSTDAATQHAAIDGLERIQLDQMPWIPLMNSPYFYNYNTLRFTGWPGKGNDYALGAPWQYPDNTKIMATVAPIR